MKIVYVWVVIIYKNTVLGQFAAGQFAAANLPRPICRGQFAAVNLPRAIAY